jgi:hypothetical protein
MMNPAKLPVNRAEHELEVVEARRLVDVLASLPESAGSAKRIGNLASALSLSVRLQHRRAAS